MTALAGWENFYVIVGSSAGALIGLQFVVITLIAEMPIAQGQAQAGDAFATPTIVHFGAVLWSYLTNRLDRMYLRNRACMYVLSAHQAPKTTIQTTIVIWMTPTATSFKIENPLC